MVRSAILAGCVSAAIGAAPAAAFQTLDVPEQPTFSDKITKKTKSGRSAEQEFEISGSIAIEKSSLAICSEGAAYSEDLDRALGACDAAVEAAPDDGDAYYYRGVVLSHLGRYEDAEADFTAAIDHQASRLAESYYQRGVCKEEQRRLREASLDFKSAAELKPEWSAARRKVEEYHWAYE